MSDPTGLLETIVRVGKHVIWEFPRELPWLVVLLVGTGVFMTFRLGWIQLRLFRHGVDVLRGKYDDPNDMGDINHFRALTTALSATVGIGNIAGVATAIHYGGSGALFWMWITAVFGMALKFAECTLSNHYRVFDGKGNAAGGPMYYIEHGLGRRWKALAVLFAVCAIVASFGGGNMIQAHTVAVSAHTALGAPAWAVGLTMATLAGLVILGGIRRIGAVTAALAPTMAGLYVAGALFVMISHAEEIPHFFVEVVSEAFHPTAGFAGTTAGLFSVTLLWGVNRGLFSNEAGQGSAGIAHAAARTEEPVREGVVAMLGPFIDTLVICTCTGAVIVSSGVWDQRRADELRVSDVRIQVDVGELETTVEFTEGRAAGVTFHVNDGEIEDAVVQHEGAPFAKTVARVGDDLEFPSGVTVRGRALQNSSALTTWAFEKGFEPWPGLGRWIVTLCVFLFAFSTCVSWSYYGDRCVVYLFGHEWVTLYRVVYTVALFVGANLALETVWGYGDIALGLMTVPNLIALLALSGVVAELTKDYLARNRGARRPRA